MKKTLKRTCAVALALATTAGVSGLDKVVNTNNNVVLAATQITAPETPLTENVLLIGNYEKSVELGSPFKLPTAKFGSAEILDKCVVKSPSGTETTYTANAETKEFADITISEIGTYTVTYTYGKFSGSVTFRSTSSNSNSITLEANNKYILPSVVGTEDTVGKFYLPSYVVKNQKGEEVDADVEIAVKDPDFKPVTVAKVTEEGEDKGAKYLDFGSEGLKPGTYTVTYTVKTAEGQFLTSTKQEFKVVEGNAFKDADKLNLSYTSDKVESVNIGKEVTLPGITAKVGTQNVPVHYSVVVKKNGTTKVTDGLVKDGDVYKFTAKEEANFYKVEYSVTSALGLKTAETSFVIETVEDSLNPTPIVVMPYTTAPTEVKNIDYKLPSTFDDENIKLLPIFAEDLGTTNPADFKFEREIVNSNYDTVYTDKDNANKTIIFNYTGDATAEAALTDSVVAKDKDGKKINLEAGKSYYAYYKVTDKAGNSKTETYKFTVKAGFDGRDSESKPANIPTVTFNDNLLESVDVDEVITFSEPTVSDENDARLETVVYYQYFKGATAVGEKLYPELGNDGKYSIDTNEARELEATSVKIFAEAKNDAYYIAEAVNASDKDEFIGRNEEIEIGINYLPSSSAQSLVTKMTGNGKVDGQEIVVGTTEIVEGQEITLPTIEFWDDDVATLDANVSIYCTLPAEEGKKAEVIDYSASAAMAIRNEKTGMYYYSGAKFTAATAGVYTVAVKAVDSAGNTAIQFLEYTVKEAKYAGALRFANIGLTDTKVELGETLRLPKASLEGKGSEDGTYDWEVRCIEAASTEYSLNKNRFVANKVGEYKIQYFMYDTSEAIPTPYGDQVHEVTITVEDTTKPEIYVDWRTSIINDEDKGEGNKVAIESTYEKNTQILLPMFSADDLSGIDADKSMITIRNSANSITRTIKYSEMYAEYAKGAKGTRMYFDFDDDAEYTITYTVYDKQGNSATKDFTVKVGDLEAPELVVKSGVIGKTEYGKSLEIDLTDSAVQEYFDIKDNSGATIDKSKIKISLTVDGKAVENLETETGKYRFNLNAAGSYKMVFSVKDSAGNETTHTEEFDIAEKGDEAVNKTEVIGTVLIVLSVVVLAGVIVYFVVSKRKMDKLYK